MVSRNGPNPRGGRARHALTLAAVGALALAGIGPASGAPIASGDFDDGDPGGWYAYGPGVTSGVVDGQLCATVPGGTPDPWDAAVQLDGVSLVVGEDYVLSFTASASTATSVPVQVGAWPHSFGASATLGTEPERFEYAFTFDPRGNDGADIEVGETATGPLGFQVGGRAAELTFCLDDVDLSAAAVELLPGEPFATDDAGNLTGGWGLTPGVELEVVDGVLCIAQPAGTTNPWDVNLTFNGVEITEGENYVLSFRASADPAQTPRVLVGENGGDYRTVLDQSPALGPELTEHSFAFTANASFPAETGDDGFEGQVAFQIGKGAAYEFCLTDVSLRRTATPPPPYEPDTGPRVRVNQHGYLPYGPKRATLVTTAAEPLAWQLRSADDALVAEGVSVPAGLDPSSGLDVHTIDFSATTTTGSGFVLVADGETSHPFDIDAEIYQQLRYDALNYFYLARSGIEIDADIVGEAYAREAGHVGVLPNLGDREVTCLTPEDEGAQWAYGDWECPAYYALDVVGGWYDAGDHGKYVVNGGLAAAQLLSTYERAIHTAGASRAALGDSTLAVPERGNGVADVLDEARWELEFLLSMQVPQGNELAGMAHHKIHDVGWTGLPLLPAQDPQQRRLHRPSTAATLNLAAAAAQGARLFADVDPAFAAELLAAARTAWDAALAHPQLYAPAAAGANGGGPYDDDDVSDEFYWAAAELFVTTGEAQFEAAVLESPHHTADIFGPSGFDWRATAALGRLTLATVPNDLPGLADVRALVVAGAEKYLANQRAEAFGTTYTPAGGYEWGSSSMVVNNQVVLATAYDLTGDVRFRDAVLEAMDYLLGRNALNVSFVTGYGEVFAKNQHSRWFANQLEPSLPNPPAGSLAGGPNSDTSTWDPTMQSTFTAGCAPAMCYLDHIQSWASNEITINWNSALSQVASFVADQGDGKVGDGPAPGDGEDPGDGEGPGDGDGGPALAAPVITRQPSSVTVKRGGTATFRVAVTGNEEPTVRWQRRTAKGTWKNIKGATGIRLTVKATPKKHQRAFRAFATNSQGSVTSKVARLTIRPAKPKVTKRPGSVRAKIGRTVTLRVKATGFPKPKVRWQRRDPGGAWHTITRTTKARVKVKVTVNKHGRQFRAVLRNKHGKVATKPVRIVVRR